MFRASATTAATLTNSKELFEKLQTFWRELSDADKLRYHEIADLQNNTDIYEYAEALRNAESVQLVEPTVYKQWHKLVLYENDLTTAVNAIKYGTGYIYGAGAVYGQAQANQFSWTTTVLDAGLICDKAIAPTKILDQSWFVVANGYITFLVNPFTIFTPKNSSSGRYIEVWCRNVELDKKLPFYRYGSILGLASSNSASYVGSIRALWELMVNGPSIQAVTKGVLAAVGLPYCAGNETVEVITTDSFYKLIITDKNVYRFHKSVTPMVSVGQVLTEGQNLVDTIQVYDLSAGWTPAKVAGLATLRSLSVSPATCPIPGELGFENVDTTWTITRLITGVSVRLPLSGDPATLAAFWAAVDAKGGMGSLLGITNPSQTMGVNPMQFLVENLIGNNTVVIVVKPQHFLANEISYFSRLLPFLPKQTLYMFRQDLGGVSDSHDLSTYTETVSVIPAIGAVTEVIAPTGTTLTFTDATPLVTVS